MKELNGKVALVTGGSKGIGRAIVSALAAEGASVWALAREAEGLDKLKEEVAGVQTLVADVSEPETASSVLRDLHPQIIVLNAGATPNMGPVHTQSWEQFSRNWETDTYMTFAFGKEALLLPLAPGSIVVTLSSGAALGGSPLSGGYAGAKRMQWFLSNYLQGESKSLERDIRFVALLPLQLMGSTELGHKAAQVYSAQQGVSEQAYLDRSGPPLTPELVARAVIELITNPDYSTGNAFGVNSQGIKSLD